MHGWSRWLATVRDDGERVLVSRRASARGVERVAQRVRALVGVRHPGLARTIASGTDPGGLWVVEEGGEGRLLSDVRCRLPQGDAVGAGLLRLLEALAYLHRNELSHGDVTADAVWCEGGRLVLTGAALGGVGGDEAEADVAGWARLAEEVLSGRPGELNGLVLAGAQQALAAQEGGRAIGAERLVRAIHGATGRSRPEQPDERAENTEEDTSGSMTTALRIGNVLATMLLGLLTTVLTVTVVIGIIALGVLWFLDQLPQEVQVPSVVGLQQEEARKRLAEEGIGIGHVRRVYQEEFEPGEVVESVPEAGMIVREGREITLVVSIGAARVKVPRVVGLHPDEARKVLEKAGLSLHEGGEIRSSAPEGEVVQQDPPPGNRVAQGEAVSVQTSGGADYGVVEITDEDDGEVKRALFRRVEIIVPQGEALQRVEVREGYGDDIDVTYDRLHRPGDRVRLDTWGRPGKQIRVLIEGEQVFKTQL